MKTQLDVIKDVTGTPKLRIVLVDGDENQELNEFVESAIKYGVRFDFYGLTADSESGLSYKKFHIVACNEQEFENKLQEELINEL